MPTTNIAIARKYPLPLFLAVVGAGLAGNYFNYPIFLNIDFLFGSIFAMLALQFFGMSRGVLAAVIIASYTYILWNQPYTIIIMTAEVAVVGWLIERRKLGIVLADTIYWLIIGMPCVYLSHHLVMHVAISNTSIIMTKQAINGITNALLARLIFTGFSLRSHAAQTSFRDISYNLLAFFVLFPALIMLAVESRSDFNKTDRDIRSTLMQDSKRIEQLFETWLENRKITIVNLAEFAASKSLQETQSFLEQVKKSDLNFLRVGLLDKDATITAYYPLIDERGNKNIGKNFADRPFIPQLKSTLQPMLSEVVMGRLGNPQPMVTMLAPVILRGAYGGYITGILSLDRIQKLIYDSFKSTATLCTLLDKNSKVIMSNRTDQTVAQPFVRGKGTSNRLDADISQWVPVVPPNISISERWKQSSYVAETSLGDLAEWKLILEQPVAPFQKALYDDYARKLILLFLILLGALALAELLSRRSIVTLEQLGLVTYNLPIRLATTGEEISWPESSVKEANHLIYNFKEMAYSLTAQFNEVFQINEKLEGRVEERTAELKASEERYRSILSTSPDDITITDMAGRILMVSPAGVTMFGYDREEDGLGLLITDFIAVEDRARALTNFALKVQGVLSGPEEYRGLRMDGSTFDMEVNSDFIRDADQHPICVVFVVRDITDRKQAEAEKAILQAQLIQAQKMQSIGTLAGGIAHDFNNILGAILGYAEMARDASPSGSVVTKDLDKVLEAGHRAAALVKQILAFSRQAETERIPLELAHMIKEAIKLLRPSLPSTITIKQQVDIDTKPILADPTQIHQIVMNLCTNAFHAMEQTGGILEISLKNCELSPEDLQHFPDVTPGRFVVLSIGDTGSGIEPEIRDKIFDPYFTTKEVGKGTGMGLAIVHGIVTVYGGFVTCESTLGRGTAFHVYFPAIEPQQTNPPGNTGEEILPGTERLLFIDDEDILAELGKAMLERLGYEVTVRTSSLEAWNTFQNQPDQFDVVITDQTMPGLTGSDLALRMLRIRPDLPIILCTGYSSLISEAKARSLGIKGFAMKPLAKKDIATLLRQVLEGNNKAN